MIFFWVVLAVLWGLPIVATLFVALAMFLSPQIHLLVEDFLFGATT